MGATYPCYFTSEIIHGLRRLPHRFARRGDPLATYTTGNRLLDRLQPPLLDAIRETLDVTAIDSGTVLYPGSLHGPLLMSSFRSVA